MKILPSSLTVKQAYWIIFFQGLFGWYETIAVFTRLPTWHSPNGWAAIPYGIASISLWIWNFIIFCKATQIVMTHIYDVSRSGITETMSQKQRTIEKEAALKKEKWLSAVFVAWILPLIMAVGSSLNGHND